MPEKDDDAERILKMMIKPYVEAAHAQGYAACQADVVAWLRAGGPAPRDATRWPCDSFADAVARGEHVVAAKEKL